MREFLAALLRAGACALALLLAACIEQEAVYRFDGAGGVEIDAVLRLDAGLLDGMPESETGELVSEALFGVLGGRTIERTADGWRSRGPAVPVARLGALLAEQRTRFEEVPGGWRFTSGDGDMMAWVQAEVQAECRAAAAGPEVAAFCELVVGALMAPDGTVGPDVLPEQLPPDLGMSREELAATLTLVRSQLAKMTLRVDLQGPVRDVVGFEPLPGGGWTFQGTLYDMVGRTFAWTVPGPAVPAEAPDGGDRSPVPVPAPAERAEGAAGTLPTPVARELGELGGAGVAYVLRGALGGGSEQAVAAVLACDADGAVTAAVSFGGSPPAGRALQVAVRRADGSVERFGPVVSGTPGSGVHAPAFAGADAWRFASSVLDTGALLSNGFVSLWNRVEPAANAAALAALETCRDGGG